MADTVRALLDGLEGYVEIAPRPELRPFVRCIWTLGEASPSLDLEPVLPDGCCEIILNHGDPFRSEAGVQPLWIAVGQLRRPLSIAATGVARLVGIRFEPGGLFAFLGGQSLGELTGTSVDLEGSLREALRGARVVASIESALLDRMRPGSGFVRAAVGEIRRSGGVIAIGELARRLDVNGRTLERAFAREVGIGPKLLARVERFQGVLRAIGNRRDPDWAAVALGCGYFDQAHMIRDFKGLTGTSPAAFQAAAHGLNDRFVGIVQ